MDGPEESGRGGVGLFVRKTQVTPIKSVFLSCPLMSVTKYLVD